MTIKSTLIVLLFGFVLGWLSHGAFRPETNHERSLVIEGNENDYELVVSQRDQNALVKPSHKTHEVDVDVVGSDGQSTEGSVAALIESGEYTSVMTHLVIARENGGQQFDNLKNVVLSFLQQLIDSERFEVFTEVADAYLTAFYDDIDVLLLVAESNKYSEYYFEALGVFHLAAEYADSLREKERVAAAFDRFLEDVDVHLSSQQEWYRLSQLYLQSEISGLLSTKQRIRQAAIYIENGDVYEGRKMLLEIQAQGNLSDAGEKLLARIDFKNDDGLQSANSPQYESDIALKVHANQFLVDVSFEVGGSTSLLIDTGATMTTLSKAGFSQIRSHSSLFEIGSRMFSTANGVTKGRIYRVAEFTIGDYRFENMEVAVLDFDMSHGVEGLLGMNVLGQFKFHIDQENKKLLLSPRY